MSAGSASADEQNKEFQQQVATYIAWVNSQLKKRAGMVPVTDLRTDFSDGVVLATLVEIISSEKLEGIKNPAVELEEKQHNVNAVLKFISSKNIRMHHITDRDVIGGNMKSLMRLILTLAAHFKPSSVGSHKSVSAAAANANVALGDMHRRVTSSGGFRPRWKNSTPSQESHRQAQTSTPASSRTTSYASNRSEPALTGLEDSSFTLNKLPSQSELLSTPSLPEKGKQRRPEMLHTPTSIRDLSSINSEVIVRSSGDRSSLSTSEKLSECYDDLEAELSSAKDLVSLVQNLLLNGEIPGENHSESDVVCPPLEASNANEEILFLQSQLDLSQHESSRLKSELADVRQECRSTTANSSALATRSQQQHKELASLKQQVLKLNLVNETLKKDNEFLSAQVDEYKRVNHELSSDLAEKHASMKLLKDEMATTSTQLKKIGDDSKHKLNSVQQLEMQVQELRHQLRILQRHKQTGSRMSGNEQKVITESLTSLRSTLSPHDSRQHILDTLEQAFMSMAEYGQRSETPAFRSSEMSRHPQTYSPRSRKKEKSQNGPSTTIIYFTERNMTPSRALIYKRIGDITLRDFKSALRTSDVYKYNFKALDPEFGTVKKELFQDDEVVPGWEGKIVAWLDRDTSNGHG